MSLKTVLIDDSRFQLHQMEKMLIELGYEVNAFLNGNDALKYIEENSCDCLFTDLLMPEIDGFEVIKQAKAKFPELDVVVLTANIQKSAEEQCNELGVTYFINKPVEKGTLSTIVRKISESREKNEQHAS